MTNYNNPGYGCKGGPPYVMGDITYHYPEDELFNNLSDTEEEEVKELHEETVKVFVSNSKPMEIEKIGPVTIPLGQHPRSFKVVPGPQTVLISQDGQIQSVIINQDQEEDVVHNHALAVSFPIKDVINLINRLERYFNRNAISSQNFAQMVLGISSSFFSSLKKGARTTPGKMNYRRLVIWGRVQYYLDNLATFYIAPAPKRAKSLPARGKSFKGPRTRSLLGGLRGQSIKSEEFNSSYSFLPSSEVRGFSNDFGVYELEVVSISDGVLEEGAILREGDVVEEVTVLATGDVMEEVAVLSEVDLSYYYPTSSTFRGESYSVEMPQIDNELLEAVSFVTN